MRILFVTYGLPYPPDSGARSRDYHLIKAVATRHPVILLSQLERADEAQHIPHLQTFCEHVDVVAPQPQSWVSHVRRLAVWLRAGRPLAAYSYVHDAMSAKINACLFRWPVDVVQIEHSFLAPYIDFFPVPAWKESLPDRRPVTVLDLHNIGETQYRRMLNLNMGSGEWFLFLVKWLMMRGWEVRYAAKYDQVLTVSSRERDWLTATNPRLRVSVVDNGVDTVAYRPLDPSPMTGRLLFVGTLGYAPNIDAVLHFSDAILPLIQRDNPDVTLHIVGRYPRPQVRSVATRPGVMLTENVVDVRPMYEQADVCIVPLQAGGGTRLKILEAMALGRPVVSTTVGAEGLAVVDGEHVLLADTPELFARQVARLLNEPELRTRLVENARRLVETHYDWATLGKRLEGIYKNEHNIDVSGLS